MRHLLSTLVLTLALPGLALAQDACLDYWAVGPSGCDGSRPVEPQPVLPTPQMPKPAPAAKPVDPVEQFYQTYDKPPRAFVEFQLNPTPANAMAWVQEYQTIINKSSQTAEAWRQAETAFNQYQQTGNLPPEFAQALTDEERQQVMNIVQTGGVKPYNFSENSPTSSLPQTFQNAVRGVPNKPAVTAPTTPKVDALSSLNRGSRVATETAEPNRLSLAALNKGEDKTDSDVIKVNYYFSAVCPFCRRFEPEFAKVQKQFNTKRLDVTCVDMTPGERVPTNKQGAVDWKWRPLAPGEKDANQVRATPSLLIDFGPTKSLELVEGFVESGQLLSYLNKKVAE